MNVENFLSYLNSDFYTGVPDSLLRPLCDFLIEKYAVSEKHIVAANEGNAAALAAGYYLSTGKIPVVYMQNSGIGNIVNPAASLLHSKVYAIPCIYIVGWRGEPGLHDEPQHIFQGEITVRLLEDLGIKTFIIDENTMDKDMEENQKVMLETLGRNEGVAFVVRKNALSYQNKAEYKNSFSIVREKALEYIADIAQEDIIVSTTGKISRELFEIRERKGQGHSHDFLTVGSMGHCSSIALGIAEQKKERTIWCIDGDGAAIMHMGAFAVIGSRKPGNFIHVLMDNGAHETVGGMPTVSGTMDWAKIASGCGYENIVCVGEIEELKDALESARNTKGLSLVIIQCALGSRKDLGRPTTTAEENKTCFMNYLLG